MDPPVVGPRPVRDEIVHKRGPQGHENHGRHETGAFGHRAEDEGGGDGGKLHLVDHEGDGRDGGRGVREGVVSEGVERTHAEVADEGSAGLGEGQTEAEEEKLDRHHGLLWNRRQTFNQSINH